jgi:ribitol 2-dehydrogenase
LGQRLEGKVALVTGASSGIGRAIALALGQEGVKLALVGRSAGRLQAVADKAGGNALVLPADLTEPDAVKHVVDATIKTLRPGRHSPAQCRPLYSR